MRTATTKNSKAGGSGGTAGTTSEMSMMFRTVKVTGKNDFSNTTVAVDDKEILIGSAFKIKWKHVEKFNIVIDGGPNGHYRNTTYIEICDDGKKNTDGGKQRVFTMIGPVVDHSSSSSSSSKWNSFAKHVQGIWDAIEKKRNKKERKRLEEEKEKKAKELAQQKRSNRNGGGGRGGVGGAVYGRRYQQQQFDKREKFLRANRSNMSYNATLDHHHDDYYGEEHEHHGDDDDDIDEMLSDGGGDVGVPGHIPDGGNSTSVFGKRGNSNVRGKNRKQSYEKMMDVEKIFANEDDDSVAGGGDDDDSNHEDKKDDDASSPDRNVDDANSKSDGDDVDKNVEDPTMEVDKDDVDDDDASMSGVENVDDDIAVEFDEEASDDVKENKPYPSNKKSNSTKKGRSSTDASPSPKKDAEAKGTKKRKLAKLTKKTAVAKKLGKEVDGDSSDDEDVFGTSSMFTPSSQRLVSPGTTSIRRLKRRVLDDDDDDDDEVEGTKATVPGSSPNSKEEDDEETDSDIKDNTPSVSSFFKPVKKMASKSKASPTGDSKASSSKPVQKSVSSSGRNLSTPKDNEQNKTNITKKPKTKTGDILEEEDSDATANGDDDISLNLPASLKMSTTKKKSQSIQNFFTPRNTKTTAASSPTTDDTQSEVATVVPGSEMMSSNSPGVFTVNSDHHSGTTTPPSNKNKRRGSGMWKNIPVKKPVVDSGELEEDRIEEYGSSQSVTARTPPTSRRLELADTSMKRTLTSGKRPRKKPPGTRFKHSSADDALDLADKFKPVTYFSPKSAKRTTPIRSPNNVGRSWEDRSPARALYQQQQSNDDAAPSTNKWRGLKNIGNSCYMNASLQMLFSVPEFMHALSDYHEKDANEPLLIDRLIHTWKFLNADKPFAFNPRPLKTAVDQLTNKFEGYHQRDAHEFLGDLIDCVHEQDIAPNGGTSKEGGNVPNDVEPTQDSSLTTSTSSRRQEPADEFFSLNVEVNLKCMSCGYSRCKNELYRNLSLDIDPSEEQRQSGNLKRSVQKSLDRFFSTEVREIKCEKCGDGQFAEQTMRILSAPKTLILHLKRFAVVEAPRQTTDQVEENQPNVNHQHDVEFCIRKKKNPVKLDKEVSLVKYFKKQPEKDSDDMSSSAGVGSAAGGSRTDESMGRQQSSSKPYEIRAVVHHIGKTADSGHYTADAVRFRDETNDEQWVSYDDAFAEELTVDQTLDEQNKQRTAYMVLYSLSS